MDTEKLLETRRFDCFWVIILETQCSVIVPGTKTDLQPDEEAIRHLSRHLNARRTSLEMIGAKETKISHKPRLICQLAE